MARDRKELEHFLSQQYLAQSLTLGEIGTLLEYTECVEFNKDDLVADVGEVGEALFFVLSGEVTLVHVSGKDEVEVGRMLAGELMGEMSFFDREPRSARLKARKKQTEVLRMSIPTIFMHTVVKSRADNIIHILEEQATGMIAQKAERSASR